MSMEAQKIIDRALDLSSEERARIVDELISSLNEPDEAIDALWRKDVEDRIDTYNSGKLRFVPLQEVLAKYQQ